MTAAQLSGRPLGGHHQRQWQLSEVFVITYTYKHRLVLLVYHYAALIC